jgi:hypothetical protein
MNVTLVWVADDHREYDSQYGRKAAFKVKLDDGRMGEVTSNADTVTKRQEQFKGFIGKPTDLVVEDGGKWDDGNPKPLRVKLPQQQQQNTSKSRDWVPRYADSEVGWREADERVDRRRALELAQAEGVGITTELATKFYDWLRETAQASSDSGVARRPPAGATANAGSPRVSGPPSSEATEAGPSSAAEEAARPNRSDADTNAPEPGEVEAKGVGEAPNATTSPATVALPMDEPDARATDEQWSRLLTISGDSKVRATNRINKVNHTSYTVATAQEGATRAEVAAAITGEAA